MKHAPAIADGSFQKRGSGVRAPTADWPSRCFEETTRMPRRVFRYRAAPRSKRQSRFIAVWELSPEPVSLSRQRGGGDARNPATAIRQLPQGPTAPFLLVGTAPFGERLADGSLADCAGGV